MTDDNGTERAAHAREGHAPWTLWQRMAFRFAFVFGLLFNDGLGLLLWPWPWLNRHVAKWTDWPTDKLAVWVGKHVFHLQGVAATPHPTGSGDTALGWIQTLDAVAIALLACVVWTLVSERRARRRLEYRTLYAWLRLILRFSLAYALLNYGFIKVFPLQMPMPGTEALNTTYGASSPMGLAWRFIGLSTIYRIFGGLAEVVPGVLLLFRRTSMLGALGAVAVMTNVVMLNLGYDIPVKLYSIELLLIAVFLLLPDMRALWRFFVEWKPAVLQGLWVRRPERRSLRIAICVLQVAVVAHLIYMSAVKSYGLWQDTRSAIAGSWLVDSSSGALAGLQWEKFDCTNAFGFKAGPAKKEEFYSMRLLRRQHTVEVIRDEDYDNDSAKPIATLRWADVGGGKVTLAGTWNGQPASATMHRVVAGKSPFEQRGFHWVQEYPYHR